MGTDKHGANIFEKPQAYDLTQKAEFLRLMREAAGYLMTCRSDHHGTDREGRNFAIAALKELAESGAELRITKTAQ
jgi:hypothetical protein